MGAVLPRLFTEDEGQDVIEYALLIAFAGLAGIAAFVAIQNAISAGYVGWDNAEQALSEPPPPQ